MVWLWRSKLVGVRTHHATLFESQEKIRFMYCDFPNVRWWSNHLWYLYLLIVSLVLKILSYATSIRKMMLCFVTYRDVVITTVYISLYWCILIHFKVLPHHLKHSSRHNIKHHVYIKCMLWDIYILSHTNYSHNSHFVNTYTQSRLWDRL